MYGQQFMPNQMYGQPNVMSYPPSMLPTQVTPGMPSSATGPMISGYAPSSTTGYAANVVGGGSALGNAHSNATNPMLPTSGNGSGRGGNAFVPPVPQSAVAPGGAASNSHNATPVPRSQQTLQQQQQQQQQQQSQAPQQQQQPGVTLASQSSQSLQQQQQPLLAAPGSSQMGPAWQSVAAAQSRPPQRQRNNDIGQVSRVLHMRNVTPDVTQLSIQNLAQNFGKITHIVMLRQMNQALVEMESIKAAQQLVDFFRDPGYAEVDGRRVFIRYSNHQNLTATHYVSRTLLVSMFNTQYDVSAAAQITPEIVFRIFAPYGAVQKIVVLPKNESSQWNHNRVQALVQFKDCESAEHVKNILQGQPVTLGDTITFTLDIQYSRMDEIKTTNPLTSLIVDENGNTHRPQPPATRAPPSNEMNVPGMPAGAIYGTAAHPPSVGQATAIPPSAQQWS